MAWELLGEEDLPTEWDWRNVGGINFMGWSKNQHIPHYCGSCWAQAATSALADRFNILLNGTKTAPIDLNPQVLINCKKGGDCQGGNPGKVYVYAHTTGIPDSTCMQYVAQNLDKDECEAIDICRDCSPPPPSPDDDGLSGCYAVDHQKYYASHLYSVVGATQMKAEIFENGPISCFIDATHTLEKYAGGILSEVKLNIELNHVLEVIGYGVDETGLEYWIGKNSWGTYWGEYGYFRIKMHSDNLGIETACSAAIPSLTKPSTQELLQ